MRTKEIERLEEREMRDQGLSPCDLCDSRFLKNCQCIGEEFALEGTPLGKEGAKMATVQHKRMKLTLHRPSQYPLPQGLLVGISEA